jgi:hypothetical protein
VTKYLAHGKNLTKRRRARMKPNKQFENPHWKSDQQLMNMKKKLLSTIPSGIPPQIVKKKINHLSVDEVLDLPLKIGIPGDTWAYLNDKAKIATAEAAKDAGAVYSVTYTTPLEDKHFPQSYPTVQSVHGMFNAAKNCYEYTVTFSNIPEGDLVLNGITYHITSAKETTSKIDVAVEKLDYLQTQYTTYPSPWYSQYQKQTSPSVGVSTYYGMSLHEVFALVSKELPYGWSPTSKTMWGSVSAEPALLFSVGRMDAQNSWDAQMPTFKIPIKGNKEEFLELVVKTVRENIVTLMERKQRNLQAVEVTPSGIHELTLPPILNPKELFIPSNISTTTTSASTVSFSNTYPKQEEATILSKMNASISDLNV